MIPSAPPDVIDRDTKPPNMPPERPKAQPDAPSTDVEQALARALEAAAGDGRFDVVAQLARELEARRLAGDATVVPIGGRRRGGST